MANGNEDPRGAREEDRSVRRNGAGGDSSPPGGAPPRLPAARVWSVLRGYAVAPAAVAVALAVTFWLYPFITPTVYLCFFAAVVASAAAGGTGPAVLAALLSLAVGGYFFVPPLHSVDLGAGNVTRAIAFGLVAALAGWLSDRQRRANDQLRAANAAIASERERLRATFHNAGVGIVEVAGEEDRIVAANDRMCRILGYSPEDLLGLTVREITHPEDRPRSDALNAAVHAGKRAVSDYEKRYLKRDGTPLWVHVTVSAIRDAEGRWVRSIATVADISERRRAEEALRESEEQLARAQAIAHLGSWELDLARNRLTWSDEVYRIFGLEPQQFGATYEAFLDHVHPDDRAAVDAAYSGSLREGRDIYEIEHRVVRHATGEVREVHEKCEHIRDAAGNIVRSVGMVHDITERKRAEARQHEAAERTRALQEITAGFSGALTPAEVGEVVVRQGLSMLGAAAGSLCTVSEEGGWIEVVRAIGYSEEVLAHWRRFAVDAPAPIADAVRTGEPVFLTDKETWVSSYPTPGPQDSGHEAAAALPLQVAGRVVGAIGLSFAAPRQFGTDDRAFLDAVARQAAQALERARLYVAEREARAEAEEANQAKDQFVALVSHELRNPLNAITSGVHLLKQSCPVEGRAARAMEIVERNTALQARLVNDLLDLSRLQRGKLLLQRAPVDLAKVVGAACRSYEAQAREAGLTLSCDCEPELWVHGDFDRLQQVVLNLLSNAVKFTPEGGAITVRAERADGRGGVGEWESGRAGASPLSHSPIPPLPSARLVVEDTGIGLDRTMLDALFGMFHQGEVGGQGKPGLGIGLALVKGIVERHGGHVRAESEGPGKGSRFTVELPMTEVRSEGPFTAHSQLPTPPFPRVLLVEDNADARTMITDGLALAGCEVRSAGSGEEALALVRSDVAATAATSGQVPWMPDIMLVDIGLPGMDGYEFLRRVHREPGMADVPAFAVTGWGSEEDVRRGREAGFAGHFVKPVDMAALRRVLPGGG